MTNVPVDPTTTSPANAASYALPDFYANPVGPFRVPRERAEAFYIEVRQLDCSEMERLSLRNAMEQGYLITHPRDWTAPGRTIVSSCWEAKCRLLAIPFILFYPRRRYSTMEMDLRPAHAWIKREHCEHLREAISSYDIAKPTRNWRNCGGPDIWSAGKIPVGKIDELAAILLDAAMNHCEGDGAGCFDPFAPGEDPPCHC